MKDQYYLLTHFKQQLFTLKGELLLKKSCPLQAAENFYKALTFGSVYRRSARLRVLREFEKAVENMKSKDRGLEYEILKRKNVLEDVKKISSFIRSDSREVLFLFDNSVKSLPFILKIKPVILKVCDDVLNQRDKLGIECFSDKLKRIVDIKKRKDFSG